MRVKEILSELLPTNSNACITQEDKPLFVNSSVFVGNIEYGTVRFVVMSKGKPDETNTFIYRFPVGDYYPNTLRDKMKELKGIVYEEALPNMVRRASNKFGQYKMIEARNDYDAVERRLILSVLMYVTDDSALVINSETTLNLLKAGFENAWNETFGKIVNYVDSYIQMYEE